MDASVPTDIATALARLIRSRRSIRRYLERPVAPGTVDRLLTAAGWAPSLHNRQPWRFRIVTDEATKARLSTAMGARLRADRAADGDEAADIERDVARSYARITGAPVVFLVALTRAANDAYPDERRGHAEYLMAVQSTAMAVQNLLLAAHAEGLGACWMCAPLFCPEIARVALALPEDWEPQALVTLGWPAGRGKPASRRPVGAVADRAVPGQGARR